MCVLKPTLSLTHLVLVGSIGLQLHHRITRGTHEGIAYVSAAYGRISNTSESVISLDLHHEL